MPNQFNFEYSWGGAERSRPQAPPPADPAATTLSVQIERLTFTSSSTGWSVLRVVDAEGRDAVAVGSMLNPHIGEWVELSGAWVDDTTWGWQFRFDSYMPQLPANAQQAEAYLASGIIAGIGSATAQSIVKHFGDDTLRVLNEDIGRLIEVPGIGPKKRAQIAQGWAETTQQRAIAIALGAVGASTSLAGPIWEAFGSDGVAIISTNPYALTKARGIGFTTCDQIARRLGWARSDPRRVSAGLEHTLDEAQSSGHCYLPDGELLDSAARLLGVGAGVCAEAVALAVEEGRIVVEGERVYAERMHYLECDLAAQLERLITAPLAAPSSTQAAQIDVLLAECGLTAEQERAVRAAVAYPVTVLTGGPGVGKSHTVKSIAQVADICGWSVALCAPTGRAARRMSELADGAPSATVHRLIGLGARPGGGATYDPETPLPVDLLVCDESSMLDVSLARHLVRALASGTRVVFVGDIDQLPSVGPGAVLADLIAATVPTVALTQIFRQVADSGIVQVAHAVNAGQLPDLGCWEDLYYWATPDADQAADRLVAMVCDRIPAKFGLGPSDIQVLTPKRSGSCGVVALNRRLQERLNPGSGREYTVVVDGQEMAFRPGDRAMIVKNNYDKGAAGVFNGTPVRIVEVNPEPGKDEEGNDQAAVTVETDEGERIGYAASEVRQLTLAYAITIHKSQGSQYPCVVVPVTMQAYTMLQRNLVYTAITRAQRLVVLVGGRPALRRAVATEDAAVRYTGLSDRLGAVAAK